MGKNFGEFVGKFLSILGSSLQNTYKPDMYNSKAMASMLVISRHYLVYVCISTRLSSFHASYILTEKMDTHTNCI